MSSVFEPGKSEAHIEQIGGKAYNLAILATRNQAVPSWFAVTVAGQATQDLDAVVTTWQNHFSPDRLLAVRSSAVDEDGAGGSFAGMHDSFLFVRGEEPLREAVKKVWASVHNERAMTYRRENNLATENLQIAVVVQEMIDAAVSGVLFTVNPSNENVQEVMISAVYGAGEGLVSAGFDADTFVLNKKGEEVSRDIADKTEQLVLDTNKGSGLIKTEVPHALSNTPTLSDAQLAELLKAGIAIEKIYGTPQDIEWCYDKNGKLFIVQSRPITTLHEYGPAAGNRLLWDNSNIIESYSGVTSPMTFSFIRHAYNIVYHCFCEVMGISDKTVRANERVFANMLGMFRGQVYYNLQNWYRLIKLFPGYNYNREFMESMMGVSEEGTVEDEQKQTFAQKYFVELPALIRLVLRTTKNFRNLDGHVLDFEANFVLNYARWGDMEFNDMPPHELMAVYHEMEDKLLWEWKAPIINDFFVMIYYGTLKKLCQKWCGDESGTLQNDLLCGEGGIESTEPTKRLMSLAKIALQTPALAEQIKTESAKTILSTLHEHQEFYLAFAEYLGEFGFRCMNELKLEEPSLIEEPGFLFVVLRNYLVSDKKDALDFAAMEAREKGIRREAEEKAFSAIGNPMKRALFKRVLRNARLGVKNRENMRFARTRIYGQLRELLNAVGGHFADEGLLDEAHDIYYLGLDEVWNFVKGTAITTDLRALAALRKKEFDTYRADEEAMPDDRFETYGLAYHRNRFRRPPQKMEPPEPGTLRGTGCCPGTVKGTVRVLRSPTDSMQLNGEILVAARTDPGWVPLYPSVSGLLIERGSILSHSAIVAREMGIPTIVGITQLIDTLNDGDEVEMDGATGVILLHTEEDDQRSGTSAEE